MGTPFPALWRLFLLLVTLVAFAVPVVAGDPLEAPHVEGAPVVDGDLSDPYWAGAAKYTLTFDGILKQDATRMVELLLAHNETHLFMGLRHTTAEGTHDGDFLLVTFDPTRDPERATGPYDLLRYGWPASQPMTDQFWNGTEWQDDAEKGCGETSSAARTAADGTWQYELAKPLNGDACDLRAVPGATLGFRIELRENIPAPLHGDNYRWPAGSTYRDGDPASWGGLHLVGTATSEPSWQGQDDAEADASDHGTTADEGIETRSEDGDEGTDGRTGHAGHSEEAPLPLAGVLLVGLVAVARAHKLRRPGV